LNTQNRWYSNASQIDARQIFLSDNAKAANVTIYAIQVNTGGYPTSSVLQYCASGTDKFYLVTSASQTPSVFTSIGTSLSRSCASRNNPATIGARKKPGRNGRAFVFDRRGADQCAAGVNFATRPS
jgi:hypothetical protein